MPQLWTETFITQYFWLLLILFTFYYFIYTQVIPTISQTIKSRQQTEEIATASADKQEESNHAPLFSQIKQTLDTNAKNWDLVQADWLETNPEETDLIETKLSEETLESLTTEEDSEMSLEDFLKEP